MARRGGGGGGGGGGGYNVTTILMAFPLGLLVLRLLYDVLPLWVLGAACLVALVVYRRATSTATAGAGLAEQAAQADRLAAKLIEEEEQLRKRQQSKELKVKVRRSVGCRVVVCRLLPAGVVASRGAAAVARGAATVPLVCECLSAWRRARCLAADEGKACAAARRQEVAGCAGAEA
jgi:hypothetical protein